MDDCIPLRTIAILTSLPMELIKKEDLWSNQFMTSKISNGCFRKSIL